MVTHFESKKRRLLKTKGAKPNKNPYGVKIKKIKNLLSVRDKNTSFYTKNK